MARRIGVLAVQGDFLEHIRMLSALNVKAIPIRLPKDLASVDSLIIPGGESTTISRLMETFGLIKPIKDFAREGNPVWGTCAGMIVAAEHVSDLDREPLGLIDIKVQRNAFGRQIDSFEVNIMVTGLKNKPFPAIFIRAPIIEKVNSNVAILAKLDDGTIIAAQHKNILVTSFHPELTKDTRVHELFLGLKISTREVN
jgi:5'-phosphate synthase pdxT subunit